MLGNMDLAFFILTLTACYREFPWLSIPALCPARTKATTYEPRQEREIRRTTSNPYDLPGQDT